MSIRANIDVGELNERVTLQRVTFSRDSTTGDAEPSWSNLVTCWARVDGVTVREARAAGAIQSLLDYTVWVRSDVIDRYSIVQADRISWRGKVLDILAIPDQQVRGRKTAIMCRAGASDG